MILLEYLPKELIAIVRAYCIEDTDHVMLYWPFDKFVEYPESLVDICEAGHLGLLKQSTLKGTEAIDIASKYGHLSVSI